MSKKLAIKGHPTRGKEVIELLEMMGGSNIYNLLCNNSYMYYVNDVHQNIIRGKKDMLDDEDMQFFTLEEFLEKFPFKVGDVVVYTKFGDNCDDYPVVIESMKWTGTTIEYTFDDYVTCLAKDLKMWNDVSTNKDTDDIKPGNGKRERTREDVIFDSIIWHLRNSVNNGKQNLSGGECEDYFREVVKKNNENKMKNVLAELLEHIKTTPKEELEREFKEIAEWSNVGPTVEEFRTFCECVNKKPVYPKTYAECAKIMNCPIDGPSGWLFNFDANIKDTYYRKIDILMGKFIKLRICRDAYWKIYGEQMGLDGPWKANFTQDSGIKYNILFANGEVIWNRLECEGIICSRVLAFPTPEIRDEFYDNFKDLIEECKELL